MQRFVRSTLYFYTVLFFLSCATAQVQTAATDAKRQRRPRPSAPQEIDFLTLGYTAAQKILLMINNNRSGETPVVLTAYALDGSAHHIANLALASRESKLIDITERMTAVGLDRTGVGYLRLDYIGGLMEVGAQLTLYPHETASAFDSPRSLSVDSKTNNRSAAFLLPRDASARIALTNVSPAPISGTAVCAGRLEPFTLGANITRLVEISVPNPPIEDEFLASHCDVVYEGLTSALRAFGVVTRNDYSAPIRFYDPATATSANLTAVAVRTDYKASAVVHNTASVPVTFVPVLRDSAVTPVAERRLEPVTLQPHASKTVLLSAPLRALESLGFSLANVTMETSAQNGALIGSLTQVDSRGIVEDIPLKTSNPPKFDRGSYPLRWTDDYTNQVTIANTSDQPLGYRALITAGNILYVLPKVTLEPNTTRVLRCRHSSP